MTQKTAIFSFIIACLFIVFDYFIQVAPGVLSNQLMSALHINATSLGVLGASFFLTYSLTQIPVGFLSDRFGPRLCIFLSLLACAIGTAIFASAGSLWIACLGRIIAGVGSAFAFLGALEIGTRLFSHKYLAFIVGVLYLCCGLGAIVGGEPLAELASWLGWRHGLFVVAGVMLFFAFIALIFIRDRQQEFFKERSQNLQHNWQAFAAYKNIKVWLLALLNFLSWAPSSVVGALWGIPYLAKVYHLSSSEAAQYFMIFWIMFSVMAPAVGWLCSHYKLGHRFLSLLFLIGFVSASALLFINHVSLSIAMIILFALALAPTAQCICFAKLKDVVPQKSQYSTASGLCNMAAIFSGTALQPLVGHLMQSHWNGAMSHGVPSYSISDFQYGLVIIPIAMLLGFACSYLLKNTVAERFRRLVPQ